ncbi:hypothetical protein [Mesobacillus maritimus]|nr:hypothetical protein [Mesobacillus maritimus]
MAKNKNKQQNKEKNLSKTEPEFAGENGLEKVAVRAQEKSK